MGVHLPAINKLEEMCVAGFALSFEIKNRHPQRAVLEAKSFQSLIIF